MEAVQLSLMRDLFQAGQWARRQHKEDTARRCFDKAMALRANPLPTGWTEYFWIRGLITYAGVKDPQGALPYFLALACQGPLYARLKPVIAQRSPASDRYKARGYFWAGLCHQRLGQQDRAQKYFQAATHYPFYFYGQLAHLALNKPFRPTFSRAPAHHKDTNKEIQAWTALWQEEQAKTGRPWLTFMPSYNALVTDLASQPSSPFACRKALDFIKRSQPLRAPFFAKSFSQNSQCIFPEAYPTAPLPRPAKDPALVYAIALAETCFNPHVVSTAGARGIMQIMPYEVPMLAKHAKVPASVEALSQEKYGWILGITEIGLKLKNYGSYPLSIAAYNAPSDRVQRWMNEGPPHGHTLEDTAVWIESIPFAETRAYVPRVLEHWAIYNHLLGQTPSKAQWTGVLSMANSRLPYASHASAVTSASMTSLRPTFRPRPKTGAPTIVALSKKPAGPTRGKGKIVPKQNRKSKSKPKHTKKGGRV